MTAKEDILILESPWKDGRSIESYCGPVCAAVEVLNAPPQDRVDRILAGIDEAIEAIQSVAAERGANAIACPALEIDPFGEKIVIRAGGSAFELKPQAPSRWARRV